MIVRLGMAPRRVGSTFAEFQRHWRDEHAAVALNIPGLRAYLQNHNVLSRSGRPVLPYPGFDACSEIVFDDLAAMDAGFASPAYQGEVRTDEDLLIDKSRFFMLLGDRVIVDDQPPATNSVKLLTFMRVHPLSDPARLIDLTRGAYASLARAAGATRHEQLVPSLDAHAGRQPAPCDLVDNLWFPSVGTALDFVGGPAGNEADSCLAGTVFGRERLLATVRVVRALTESPS